MIRFILNDVEIKTALPPGFLLLDFIRYEQHLTGTKIGCREGDCGACSILIGETKDGRVSYTSATSCLMPLGNAKGKHIVTIEGLNIDGLNAVQQAFSDEGATQCGFCTPGFIVSLTGHCMAENIVDSKSVIDSINGNICRCTGYKSIERAAAAINNIMQQRSNMDALEFAVNNRFIPPYFLSIKDRLQKPELTENSQNILPNGKFLGGGTDLYVQQHETMVHADINFLFNRTDLKFIRQHGNTCELGGAVTVADIAASSIFKKHFPELRKYMELVSSTQIRNMATVAGNFTNASPIGDLTIFFLALNADIVLSNGERKRTLPLRLFYKGYKDLDKSPQEFIETISFSLPSENDFFNVEKVSKRTHLDIASVNSAIFIKIKNGLVETAGLSAGGVGPVPFYLRDSSKYLVGKKIDENVCKELLQIVQQEISPISDARGTIKYKRLLLSQLIKAHFITLFPQLSAEKILLA